MIKFSVMFRQPDDIDNFENTYNDFLALVERMPDIERRQVVHVLGSPQGQAPYYRLLELYYADEMALRTALMSTAAEIKAMAREGRNLSICPRACFAA